MKDYDQLFQSALIDVEKSEDLKTLEEFRIKYFGKNGIISKELKSLTSLNEEDKKNFGKKLNTFKSNFFSSINKKKTDLEEQLIDQQLKSEFIDSTLPTRESRDVQAKLHPISFTINEIFSILNGMGLSYEEGPDVENDFYNFTALNIPKNHPARQMHDTFYLDSIDKKNHVLRTHTSPVQIRSLEKNKLPLKIFAPGRTYRCDSDITHTPMFHQVEGLIVDTNINFGNLKWFLEYFCKKFFNKNDLKLRFRPSYFPFTEPSAEVDINCKIESGKIHLGEGNQWMEILGCGMVHPEVFNLSGINQKNIKGFAFGMGIERLAMLKYGMPDLRKFFEGDLKWLNHYGFSFLDSKV